MKRHNGQTLAHAAAFGGHTDVLQVSLVVEVVAIVVGVVEVVVGLGKGGS